MSARNIFTSADFMLAYALAEDLIPQKIEGVHIKPLTEQVLVKGTSRSQVAKMYGFEWTARVKFLSALKTIEGQILGGIGRVAPDTDIEEWPVTLKANRAHSCYRRART